MKQLYYCPEIPNYTGWAWVIKLTKFPIPIIYPTYVKRGFCQW